MKKYFLAFLIVQTYSIFSQDKTIYKDVLSSEGNYQQGNVNTILFIVKNAFSKADSVLEYGLATSFTHGEQDKIKKQHDFSGIANIDLYPKSLFSPFTFALYEFSKQRSIKDRYQGGIGVKYLLLNTKDHNSSLSIAFVLDRTSFEKTNLADVQTTRISLRLKGHDALLDNGLLFSYVSFFLPSVKDIKDYRWQMNLSIDYPISKMMSLRTSYYYNYENIVAVGKLKDDSKFSFGIKLTFQ